MDFCVIRSPVGLLRLEESEGFLVRLDRTDMPPRVPETPLLVECARQLQAYFDGCDWYEGTIAPEKFTDDMLTDTELANVAFLKAAE